MSKTDSAFGRLIAAWAPALQRPGPPIAQEPGRGPRPAANESRPTWSPSSATDSAFDADSAIAGPISVLIASAPRGARAEAPQGAGPALAVRMGRFSAYRLTHSAPAQAADLERLLRVQSPRLLLIDAALADSLGVAALRNLRRAIPATDWLLLWDIATPKGFELAVACRARGCIEWHSSAEQFVHAFRTVLAGELWFPRRAMQSLYFSLVAASEGDSLPPPEVDVGVMAGNGELTDREAEALALMRQGLTNQQIADRLGVSINTVKKHLAHAFEKRGLHHRRQLLG